jgi:hypothetical protein
MPLRVVRDEIEIIYYYCIQAQTGEQQMEGLQREREKERWLPRPARVGEKGQHDRRDDQLVQTWHQPNPPRGIRWLDEQSVEFVGAPSPTQTCTIQLEGVDLW